MQVSWWREIFKVNEGDEALSHTRLGLALARIDLQGVVPYIFEGSWSRWLAGGRCISANTSPNSTVLSCIRCALKRVFEHKRIHTEWMSDNNPVNQNVGQAPTDMDGMVV